MKILAAVLRRHEIAVPDVSFFCTLKLARRVWPHLRSHSLPNLAKAFSITYESHNAVADADTCAKIVVLAAEAVSAKAKRKKALSLEALLKKAGVEMEKLG
jgi:DNA polymerase-3 subunit epsilon